MLTDLGTTPAAPASPRQEQRWPLAALERLEDRGLFVVGCARSGTSILVDCLNLAPEVMVLQEGNLFENAARPDFIAFFNRQHHGFGNLPRKGTYLPPAALPEEGAFALFQRLGRRYRFVGDKVAFGPGDPPRQPAYFDFQATYFFHSQYLLIARRPAESVWSMTKMFPRQPAAAMVTAWLRTLRLSIDLYQAFPNVRQLFFEDFGPAALAVVAGLLGVAIAVPAGMLGERYRRSSLASTELPAPLESIRQPLAVCDDLYREYQGAFSATTLRYAGPENQSVFLERLARQIEAALGSLGAAPGQPDQPAGDVAAWLARAERAFTQGDLAGARDALAGALDLAPDDPGLLVAHGNLLLRLGEAAAARREFAQAAALAPDHAPAHLNLAGVLAQAGELQAAEAAARRALALEPASPEAAQLLTYLSQARRT